eukprot:m.180595 g.180595  ORF g.180595 m.180595 type:complete len:400 (+) comp53446_c0_seq19:367-1566(+)
MGNPHDVASVSRPMLPGEKLVISPVSDVTHLCPPNGTVFGLLMVTNYQLIFEGSNGPSFCVPLCSIESISKVGGQSSRGETSYAIDIRTKELRAIRLAFKPENHSRRSVFEALSKFCYPAADSLLNFFAFFFQGQFKTQAGWQIYNARSEFTRQRLPATWRICTANSQYELCSTYPSVFAVPASVSDDALRNVAAFRSRGRIPVLSWIHANGASMTRCSQPRVGVAGKRNADDEAYFQTLININQTDKTKLYIVDARPKANALANQAKGLGFESEANYPRTEVLFANIHNIHAMRERCQVDYLPACSLSSLPSRSRFRSRSFGNPPFSPRLYCFAACRNCEISVHRVVTSRAGSPTSRALSGSSTSWLFWLGLQRLWSTWSAVHPYWCTAVMAGIALLS